MSRPILAVLLCASALASSWAEENPGPPSKAVARPHRWPVPPVEMEQRRLETGPLDTRRQECARLAASGSSAERQQSLSLCGIGPGTVIPPEPPRPSPPSPSPVTTCDPGGCWDITGNRYTGSGSAMIRGDGKVCQQIGTMMHCN